MENPVFSAYFLLGDSDQLRGDTQHVNHGARQKHADKQKTAPDETPGTAR
jgi:hypothetical protein